MHFKKPEFFLLLRARNQIIYIFTEIKLAKAIEPFSRSWVELKKIYIFSAEM